MRILLACLLAAAAAAQDVPVVYATWTADPCTTLTVHVLAPGDPPALVLRGDDGRRIPLAAEARPVGATGWQVAAATVGGLAPGSAWSVADAEEGDALYARFRTLPLRPPLRFAAGGDLMHRPEWLAATARMVAAQEPAFALIGGDWAYDNGKEAEFARWRTLLRTWAGSRTPAGFGIPLVAAIGNHELGRGIPLERTPYQALFPDPPTRALDIGAWASLLLLDSGHASPVAGQAPWLERALAERADRAWRLAAYHVPAYPSVRDPADPVPAAIRAAWVPLFERGGVAACFENHDHALKRTHPLLGGRPAAGGVVYLGDGCWGVEPRQPAGPAERPYLAASGAQRHAWIVELDRDRGTARALAPDGAELDRCDLAVRRPAG